MMKCTEALFSETSPTAFFRKDRKDKEPKGEETSQITELEIIEKLQLILISLRSESAKAFSYFAFQNKNLQYQNDQQSHMINLLREENSLMTKFLDLYVEKYDEICPEMRALEKIRKAKQQLEMEISEKQNWTQSNCQSVSKHRSNLRTNYISTYQEERTQGPPHQVESTATSLSQNFMPQSSEISQMESTVNSFCKKPHPYHHEPVQQSDILNTDTLILEAEQSHLQISETSKIDTINGSKISNSHSRNEEIEQEFELGLESKGSNFFHSHSTSSQQQTIYKSFSFYFEDTQPISQDPDSTQQQFFSCLGRNTEGSLEPLKLDSDIERKNQILDYHFENQQKTYFPNKSEIQEKTQLLSSLKSNIVPFDGTELKDLNHSYFKSLDLKGKRERQQDLIIEKEDFLPKDGKEEIKSMRTQLRILQNKLKALFQPLPTKIAQKKIGLPRTNDEIKNFYARKSLDLENLSEMFNSLEKKSSKIKIGDCEQKKRSNPNKRIM